MQFDTHKSNILDTKLIVELDPVTVGWENNTVKSIFSFEARESGLAYFYSAEETIERLLESPESILTGRIIQNGELRESISEFFELSSLIVIVQRELSSLPRISPLFKSKIVECPSGIKKRLQLVSLNVGGVKSIFERTPHFCFSRNASMARRISSATLKSSFPASVRSLASCGSET